MPLPSEHRARQSSPKKYVRFRRENNKGGSGVDYIWGITSSGKVELQSVAFDKKKFTSQQAKGWLKKHKMKTSVEAAKNEQIKLSASAKKAAAAKAKRLRNEDMKLQHITRNFRPTVRYDKMEGKQYLVVPSIPIVEGVHNGSNGPLLYPAEEIAKTPQVWNTKPVVVYHPEINGRGVSACDPPILDSRKVGEMMNTIAENGKLKTEVWLDEQACNRIDKRILNAVRNGEIMELSTGLFTDNDIVEGEWNGEPYTAIARNYRPDHLALLPDKVGACSVEDGAGFLRVNAEIETEKEETSITIGNKFADDFYPFLEAAGIDTDKLVASELSHGGIREQIYTILRKSKPEAFIEAVYDDKFVYENNGRLYMQTYEIKDNVVTTTGMVEEVVRVVEYRTAKGTVIGNSQSEFERKDTMDKTKLINDLIANELTNFTEDDKEYLESQEVETLQKFVPKEKKAEAPVANEQQPPEKKEKEGDEVKTNQPKTFDEFVNNSPPEFRRIAQNMKRNYDADCKRMINVITANENNSFTEEQLKDKDLEELQQIARLASNKEKVDVKPNYAGNLDPEADTVTQNAGALPVPIPIMNAPAEKK